MPADNVQHTQALPDVSREVDELLQAIHPRVDGAVQEFCEQEAQAGITPATGELADAFELDVHDCATGEFNR